MLLASVLAAAPAAAQMNAVCDDLRGKLADISETIGTSHTTRQYSNAIAEQTSELARSTRDLRDRGCSDSASIADADNAAECDDIQSSIDRMQENLRYLNERRADARGDTDNDLRREIQAELRDSGCDRPQSSDDETIISNRSDAPATPEEQAMRTDSFYPPSDEDERRRTNGGFGLPQESYDAPVSPYGGNVRTVCVRTCDGGFFPMTADATTADFQRDADTCAKMCPGIQTELFFHHLPNDETTKMVSAETGAPYSAMPYAFAYKKRPPGEKSSCSCNMSAYYDEIKRENALSAPQSNPSTGSKETRPQSSITTIQTIKPPTLTPPASPQSAAQSLPVQNPPDRPYDPSNKVRQVGPQFMTTDHGQIDLRHPAAPGVKPPQ